MTNKKQSDTEVPESVQQSSEVSTKVAGDTGTLEVTPKNTHAHWQMYLDELAPGRFVLDSVGIIQGGGTRLNFAKVAGGK